jgi:hypothetical protein
MYEQMYARGCTWAPAEQPSARKGRIIGGYHFQIYDEKPDNLLCRTRPNEGGKTMATQVKIPEMFNQSVDVLSHPNETTFERYERSGSLTDAAIYVGAAAVIAGLLGLVGGLGGVISNILIPLINFFVFTGLVYYIGKQQGGTGTFDEVAYTFSLFVAPLALIVPIIGVFTAIPVLGLLVIPIKFLVGLIVLIAQAVLAYIAVRSSMNISNQQTALLTLGGAVLGTFVVYVIALSIFS